MWSCLNSNDQIVIIEKITEYNQTISISSAHCVPVYSSCCWLQPESQCRNTTGKENLWVSVIKASFCLLFFHGLKLLFKFVCILFAHHADPAAVWHSSPSPLLTWHLCLSLLINEFMDLFNPKIWDVSDQERCRSLTFIARPGAGKERGLWCMCVWSCMWCGRKQGLKKECHLFCIWRDVSTDAGIVSMAYLATLPPL